MKRNIVTTTLVLAMFGMIGIFTLHSCALHNKTREMQAYTRGIRWGSCIQIDRLPRTECDRRYPTYGEK